MTGESHEVLTNVEGGVGFVTLNRPKAINSLNQTMVDLLATVLMSWEHEDAVHAVCVLDKLGIDPSDVHRFMKCRPRQSFPRPAKCSTKCRFVTPARWRSSRSSTAICCPTTRSSWRRRAAHTRFP